MTVIAPAPFTLANATLAIGADNYEKAVSSVRFTPDVSSLTFRGLTPDAVYPDMSTPTWKVKIKFAQDWVTANSLSQYLLTNSGTQKTVVFKPQGTTTGKPIFTATLIIRPGSIGGDGSTLLDDEVEMDVVGQPVKTAAP